MKVATLAALALIPSLAMAGQTIEEAYVGTWTLPCVGPHQCTLRVFDHPTEGRRFAAFRVGTHSPEDRTLCGYVFPVVMNADGHLYTATRDFMLTIAYRGDHLQVAGIPASLCGLSLDGGYRELGD